MSNELVGMVITSNFESNKDDSIEQHLIEASNDIPNIVPNNMPNELSKDSNELLTNNETNNNLVNILLRIIVDNEALKTFNIEIDEKTKEIIKSLLSSNPTFFNEMHNSFSTVIKDNNIDFSDIPILMDLLKKLFEILNNLKNKILNSNDIADVTSNIFKFVIKVLINENLLNNSNLEEEFKNNIEKFIDSSIALIKLVNLLKNEKIGCFFKFF